MGLSMSKKSGHKSALNVSGGVKQPSSVNEEAVERIRLARKSRPGTDEFVTEIRAGNRTVLSQAITLIESALPDHQKIA